MVVVQVSETIIKGSSQSSKLCSTESFNFLKMEERNLILYAGLKFVIFSRIKGPVNQPTYADTNISSVSVSMELKSWRIQY